MKVWISYTYQYNDGVKVNQGFGSCEADLPNLVGAEVRALEKQIREELVQTMDGFAVGPHVNVLAISRLTERL